MTEQATQTITVDGVQYDLAIFSDEIKKLITIHQKWEQQVVDARLEVARSEAAVRDLTRELINKIKTELSAAEETQPAEVEVV